MIFLAVQILVTFIYVVSSSVVIYKIRPSIVNFSEFCKEKATQFTFAFYFSLLMIYIALLGVSAFTLYSIGGTIAILLGEIEWYYATGWVISVQSIITVVSLSAIFFI